MKALCLNIDNGPEWELAKQQFDAIGIEVERFQAIVEDNRPLAFNKSVHAALAAMPEGGWLFEDDIMFEGGRDVIQAAIRTLPPDFLTFHLGCNIIGSDLMKWEMPVWYGPGLCRLTNCWQTHANYYSAEAIKIILEGHALDRLDNDNNIFDDWLRRYVLSLGRSYVINPMIAYQRPRKSEIWGVEVDNTGTHRMGNEWLKNNIN